MTDVESERDRDPSSRGDPEEAWAAEVTRRVERIAYLAGEVDRLASELVAAERAAAAATREVRRLRDRWWVRAGLRASRSVRRLDPRRTGVPGPKPATEAAVTIPRRVDDAVLERLRTALLPGSAHALRVAVLVGRGDAGAATGGRLRAALDERGVHVRIESAPDRLDDLDAVVVVDPGLDIRDLPEGLPTVAVVEDASAWSGHDWFDDFDLVAAPEDQVGAVEAGSVHVPVGLERAPDAGAALLDALRVWAGRRRIDVAIGPPDRSAAPYWGDYHFGRALQRALQRRGHPTRIRLRDRWTTPGAGRADVAIHLFGLQERPVIEGQTTVLWVISHPDLVTADQLDRADHVFAASTSFASELSSRSGRDVVPLLQATDPDRFRPTPGGPEHDLLFVANSRRHRRPIVEELSPTTLDFAVYGRGWTPHLLDPRHLAGEHVPNHLLPAYYTAATIVLNDHWADMARAGFLSNRLFDAAACGAFVISDAVPSLGPTFDDGIPGFRDGAELRDLVRRALADPGARAASAERARAAVLREHTFAHRAAALEAALGNALVP